MHANTHINTTANTLTTIVPPSLHQSYTQLTNPNPNPEKAATPKPQNKTRTLRYDDAVWSLTHKRGRCSSLRKGRKLECMQHCIARDGGLVAMWLREHSKVGYNVM